jgi:hypothetical protein
VIRGTRRRHSRGQGLVEFSLAVPVILVMLLGMLEFGFAFDQTLNVAYASREGARLGAALGPGTTNVPCNTSNGVDANIVAAVQRVITSPGSPLVVSKVQQIRIFKATTTGGETAGAINVWTYVAGGGPTVDGVVLDFRQQSAGWSACTRDNGGDPDSIGVGVSYRYDFVTPLASALRFFGGGGGNPNVTISDKTVMALNPT